MRIKWYCFLKMSFPPSLEGFLAKNRKLRTLEKIENEMKKEFFLKKKRFILLKLHLYQIGKAQNMPLVAGVLYVF